MYRVISGKWKGRRIVAPKNFEVRPTTDFAKEGLFNILRNQYDFESLDVVDLFAGIGSISLEFCSRGVQDIRAVDAQRSHCQFIEQTVEKLGAESEIRVICSQVLDYVKKAERPAHIIFADPPFEYELRQYDKLLNHILDSGLWAEQSKLIIEHNSKKSLEDLPQFIACRKYGNVSYSFFGKN